MSETRREATGEPSRRRGRSLSDLIYRGTFELRAALAGSRPTESARGWKPGAAGPGWGNGATPRPR